MITHFYPAGGLYTWPSDVEKIRCEDKKRKVGPATNDRQMAMDELEDGKKNIFNQVTDFGFQRKLRGIG